MRVLITVIWVGLCCFCASSEAHDGNRIEQLVQENTKELGDTKNLLRHIDTTNDQIKSNIEQQRVWLGAIKNVDVLLGKLNLFLDAQSVVLLEALNNVTLKSGLYTERVSKELAGLARLQLSTKQQITGLEQKLEAYQNHVLTNARGIDNNILELTKLITRAVLPQLNGLQCSFDSLETSHINIEVELKSLARIKDISEDSNTRLHSLGHQLGSLNRTQEARLSALTHSVKQLKPLNSWQLENALRELIISQKRIELDLESCDKHSSPRHPAPGSHSPHPRPYESEPAAPSKPHPHVGEPIWNVKEPHHHEERSGPFYAKAYAQASEHNPKPGKPSRPSHNYEENSGPYYASAHAQAPEPKPRPSKPSRPTHNQHYGARPAKPDIDSNAGHSVSWQEPLPWESVSLYQSAPAPGPKPNQSNINRRRPSPNPKPCPREQYPHNPNRPSGPGSYGPPAPPHQYQQQGNKPGHPSPWHGDNSQPDSY